MKRYIVYCHTLNGKEYIGWTGKSLTERLEAHIKEAASGSNRHFCRAIRKYGPENIRSKILYECSNLSEIKRKEREFIRKRKSFSEGYNMTYGGDGGNTTAKYSDLEKEKLSEIRSKKASGLSNPNCAGKTREEILELAYSVFLEHDMTWSRKSYMKKAKEQGYPVNIYCSGLFLKSWKKDFLEYVRQKGHNISEIKYRPTKEHIQNNKGCRQKGGKWYYNDSIKKSKFFNPDEFEQITNEWKKGRKLKWD